MRLFGLTGGVGTGKSVAARWLGEQGVCVVDTDVLAREVVEPGQPAVAEIRAAFGNDVIGEDGTLRREEMARRVFSNSTERSRLEQILHPRIRDLWLARVAAWRAENRPRGVVVIPLLFETGAEKHFDAVVCVACSAPTQHQRLAERGWTPEQIAGRLGAQWSVQQKMARANYVVWTEGSIGVHIAQLQRIFT